jgi:hypothetical protein
MSGVAMPGVAVVEAPDNGHYVRSPGALMRAID